MRISPAITLSVLLLGGVGHGVVPDLNGQTLDKVDIKNDETLTINSVGGSNIIKQLRMYWLKDGAGVTFNITGGSLDVGLTLNNADKAQNNVAFNISNGASLTLTAGANGMGNGVFQGSNTTLQATVGGILKGNLSNDGESTITINNGGEIQGNITQIGGTMNATIEGTLTGSITSTSGVTTTKLWANKDQTPANPTATITGNISIEGGGLEGIVKGLTLKGNYTQTGGSSDIAFHHSDFQSATTLSGATTTIHFYSTNLKSISATNGTTTINLKGDQKTGTNGASGSTMEDYTGIGGVGLLRVVEGSSTKSVSQSGGTLTLQALNSTIDGSITGSNGATLDVFLNTRITPTNQWDQETISGVKSKVNGSITNSNGATLIDSSNSEITGSINQTGGTLKATLNNTTLDGSYTQNGGQLTLFRATGSTIGQGMIISSVTPGNTIPQISLSSTTVNGGIKTRTINGGISGQITDNSTINGGYDQTGRDRVYLNFSNSTLNNGVQVRDGGNARGNLALSTSYDTALLFDNSSTLNGGIISNNHSIWVELDNRSTEEGDITITGGDAYISGKGNSSFEGDLTSQDTGTTSLYLDNSTFTGDITQTGGNQNLTALDSSTIKGNILNNNTNTNFELRSNSKLDGSYTQNNGSLDWILGGEAIVSGDVTLNDVNTTLGNGAAVDKLETFKGDFTQNGGTLSGNLGGLTLEGAFTQNNGTSNITFESANFQQETKLNSPDQTNITFDNNSQLKTTTLSGSLNANNSFTLDHITTLDGNFNLVHSKVTLGVKNGSKITGSIKSTDNDNELKLDFEGTDNEIGGDLEISNGSLDGDITGTTMNGAIKLTDATTHLHIIDSSVNKGIEITRGYTLLTIDNSTIGTGFTMSGVDNQGRNPTLGLSINNGSTIEGDLTFTDTNATLGGFGDNNTITGNLVSTDSILITGGDDYVQAGHEPLPTSISGMTIQGTLKQENGTFDLTFSNNSDIQGTTTLNNGDKSHLTLQQSKMGELEIIEGDDNLVILEDQSTLEGNITFTNTEATLKALSQSTIKGDLTATATAPTTPKSHILLNNSTFIGNINQTNGEIDLNYTNGSAMTGDITLSGLEFLATLDRSSITGNFTIGDSQNTITMNNGSSINGDFVLTNNPSFTLTSSGSTMQGNITHTGEIGNGDEITLNFTNNSTLNNGTINFTGNMAIDSTNSQINSTGGINLMLGTLKLTLTNSTGTIESITTAGSNTITILTQNNSNSTINSLKMSDSSTLTLTGQNGAILNGDIKLEGTANAIITSLSNANLKVNLTPATGTTATITLNGGILEGTINQAQPQVGTMTLGTAGAFGGRWIATGDSNIATLNITNSSGNVANEALMQQDTYNTTISLADTTRDVGGASRIGLDMVKAGVAPTAGQTAERTIRVGNLSGLNGVFRVYTDIGAEASDKISAVNASGNHIMQVYYNPATFTTEIGDRYIVVAHVDDEQTTANFEGGTTQVGTQSYKTDLRKVVSENGGFDWILGKTQSGGANYGTKVISSIMQSQYRSYVLQTESLRQRMGELRDINRVHGLWGRYAMGTTYTPEDENGVEITDNYYTAWVGYDQNVLDLKGQNFYGFALSYSYVNPEGKDYVGNIHNIGFNFYDTFVARNDFYMDFVFKYILTYSDYEISYYNLAKNTPSYFNHKVMLSAEIGKKFKLTESKNHFFLQPDFQISVGYIFGNELSFVDLSQTTIDSNIGGSIPLILRTGLNAGYSLNTWLKSDFYVGTSFFYETTGGGNVDLSDSYNDVSYSHKGGFKLTLQGGFDILFTDNARVYFEAGTSFLSKTKTNYSINAGARFSFGYKNTRKLKAPPLTTQEPKKPEYDPRNIPVITDYTTEDIRNNNSATPKTPQGYDSDYFINTRKFYRDRTSVTNNPKPKY
ncbi:hypothetical protein [Helicobacter brantae]|uniref:Autotransporter domain-containing protein n=1 Tax=Helicobacter brantae TaxID=375927 RepID=A0A3D8J4K5_9HELI|nr:hypothetical protein [Helicobacter brantae]RDU72075.1 hypothetical protein CQA58_00275 [Helicobacter brantae]